MTNEELKRDREICNAATPGPWLCRIIANRKADYVSVSAIVDQDDEPVISGYEYAFSALQVDLKFACEARTRWPAALDEIERLKCRIKELEVDSGYMIMKPMAFNGHYFEKPKP